MTFLDAFNTPAKPKRKPTKKPVKHRPKMDGTRTCDLCGRNITHKASRPYKHAIWCTMCLSRHTIYPSRCKTCDGYHIPPGETELHNLDIMGELV